LLDKPAPKISVCLPTYNRAHYLRETIASMLAQTVTDFELIVADNCSTDTTAQMVAAFQDPRIRYVRNEENIGHYRNMDRALALARGAYVCIIHDDDVYAPEFLARESEMLDRHRNVGMVHCAVYVVNPDRRRLRLHRVSRRTRVAHGVSEFIRYLGGHDVCCSTVMCRREVWMRAGAFEHRLMCADWLMWLNIALCTDVAYLATPLVDMRVHGSSMTSTMDPMRWYDEFVELTEKAIDRMRELGVEPGQSVESLRRQSSARQSRRFLIAALAAAAAGANEQVQGYLAVLERLKRRGAPSIYWRTGRLLALKSARPIMRAVRTVRREFTRARVRCAGF
jgi:glycosyltransferase involved in cell wall biosynthesis